MTDYQKVKEWRKKNPEKVLEQAKRYRQAHPETNKKAKHKYRATHLAKIREKDKEYKKQLRTLDPEGQKRRYIKWKIKKEEELHKIAGRPRPCICDICLEEEITVFDHCHKSGKFRGWLCNRCNRVLGSVKDSANLLNKMILYLEKSNGKNDDKEKE